MSLIRCDEEGLYVIAGGYISRPGPIPGYSHAYRMDDGGLKAGDKVKARHIASSMLTKIVLPNGNLTYWFHEGEIRDNLLNGD